MKHSVEICLRELLFVQECVIIPGFGGFLTKYKSADIDYLNYTITPPTKSISFNRQLRNDDGLLVLTIKPGHNGLRAFVILALSSGKHFGAFHRNEAGAVEIARDMGARTLAFRSDRRGWSRVLGPHWWRDGDLHERRVV